MRPTQYFSAEALERAHALSPGDVLRFLEDFRLLHAGAPGKSKLISMKIPEALLAAFRTKAECSGVKYQTQIKRLMELWLGA